MTTIQGNGMLAALGCGMPIAPSPPVGERGRLEAIQEALQAAAGAVGAEAFVELFERGELPRPVLLGAPPGPGRAPTRGYAGGQPSLPRQTGLSRRLAQDTALRLRLEMLLGGRILLDSLSPGRILVAASSEPPSSKRGATAAWGSPIQSGSAEAFRVSLLDGLEHLLSELLGGGGPQDERGPIEKDEVSAILSDPSLTVEDQVVLMLLLVMKTFDQKIKKQADYVRQLQANVAPGGDGQQAPSIDVETLRLKRYIDKRSKMFDILRQIVDKYNQTAKNMIDSVGR